MVAELAGAPGRRSRAAGGSVRAVTAREARNEERSRLWARWQSVEKKLDGYATRRSNTPLVVLEPRA
jgi:hypothetical protein